MPFLPSKKLREIDLAPDLRDVLRRFFPSVLTVAEFDDRKVRLAVGQMRRSKERSTLEKLYVELGLAPVAPPAVDEDDFDEEEDIDSAGCLYVRGPLGDVRKAIVSAYRKHGLEPIPPVSPEELGDQEPHRVPRAEWRDDLVLVLEDVQGWTAVGSREWELSCPGHNALARELSAHFPVLALTECAAFDEVSVYQGGACIHTYVPHGKRQYLREEPPPESLLRKTFGPSALWSDPEELNPHAFDNVGFWGEADALFDAYAEDDEVEELLAFARAPSEVTETRSRKR